MAKRKTQKAAPGPHLAGNVGSEVELNSVDSGLKPRRSIPIEEVNRRVEQAVREVKASRTIYDDRVDLLDRLRDNELRIRDLESSIHHARLRNKELRIGLDRTNLAITRQMELDVE